MSDGRDGKERDADAVLAARGLVEHLGCEECEEQHVFLLRQGGREFTIGMRTVLACLSFAQEEGVVPDLPDEWWIRIAGRYQ